MEAIATARTSPAKIDTVTVPMRTCSEERFGVGVGGGSVMDLAKAGAGLFNAGEKPAVYQEGGSLEERGIPFIAVPTTAGCNAKLLGKGY